MARGMMGTPKEVDFCSPTYSVRHISSLKRKGASEAFSVVRDKNGEDCEVSAF
jgi:hypothetical protein